MSHPAAWTCRGCGFLLGHVRDGVLRPLAPVASVDARGTAWVPCPRCGGTRRWFPADAVAAAAGERRPPDQPG